MFSLLNLAFEKLIARTQKSTVAMHDGKYSNAFHALLLNS